MTDRLRSGTSVVISGPAGVGKTRLMAEAIAREVDTGRVVERLSVATSAVHLPLAPFAHLVPTGLGDVGVDAIQQVLDAIRDRGAGAALLVSLDDAHRLDALSASILHQAALAGVAQVVATARAGEPVPDGVEQIARSEIGARIDLLPLDTASMIELTGHILGGPVEGATLARIDHATSGLPLAVIELLHHGRATGHIAERGGLWTWTGGIGENLRLRSLLGLRLDDLPTGAREVLELVALGEPLPVDVLETIADPVDVTLLEREGHLAVDGSPLVVRPSHPLVAEQVMEELGALSRRQRLHRLVDAFAARPQPSDPDDRMRVALWSLDCGRDVAVDELRFTARNARHRQADVESERLARAAYERSPDFATGVLLGQTLHGLGRFDDADEVLRSVEPMIETDRDALELAASRALTLRYGLDRSDEAVELVERYRRRLASTGLDWELRSLGARDASMQGELGQVLELWEEARSGGAPEQVCYDIAEWACGALSLMGRTSACQELLGWIAAASPECAASNPRTSMFAQFYWVLAMATTGDVGAADAIATPFYEAALGSSNTVVRSYGAVILGFIAGHRGDLRAAERFAREGCSVPPTSLSVRLSALCGLARVLALQGRVGDAEAVLLTIDAEEPVALAQHRQLKQATRASTMYADGRTTEAIQLLRDEAAAAAAKGQLSAAVQTLFDLVRLGHADKAVADQLHVLAAQVEGPFVALCARLASASVAGAGDQLVAVADDAAAAELRLVEVVALTAAVRVEQGRGRRSNAAKLIARRDEVATACPGLPAPVDQVDLGLSTRELEVARLAASDLSDKAIAEQLVVSVRTVNAHMRSIHRKLGVSSRSELADIPGLRDGS